MTAIGYEVRLTHRHAHLFDLRLTIAKPQALQTLSLPVWIPGSYLVREFAKHLQQLTGEQGGRTIPLKQLDKSHWQADCDPAQALVLHYQVYAFDASVRSAWLDGQRGFF